MATSYQPLTALKNNKLNSQPIHIHTPNAKLPPCPCALSLRHPFLLPIPYSTMGSLTNLPQRKEVNPGRLPPWVKEGHKDIITAPFFLYIIMLKFWKCLNVHNDFYKNSHNRMTITWLLAVLCPIKFILNVLDHLHFFPNNGPYKLILILHPLSRHLHHPILPSHHLCSNHVYQVYPHEYLTFRPCSHTQKGNSFWGNDPVPGESALQCQSPLHWRAWFGLRKNLTNNKDIYAGVNPWKGCIWCRKIIFHPD